MLATCAELGIGFLAYSPLGRGFLSGQVKRYEDLAPDDFRRSNPRFQGDAFAKNLALVTEVESIAKAKGCTASQRRRRHALHGSDDEVRQRVTRVTRVVFSAA